jgi:hypothetical protein
MPQRYQGSRRHPHPVGASEPRCIPARPRRVAACAAAWSLVLGRNPAYRPTRPSPSCSWRFSWPLNWCFVRQYWPTLVDCGGRLTAQQRPRDGPGLIFKQWLPGRLVRHPVAQAPPCRAASARSRRSAPPDERPGPGGRGLVASGARRGADRSRHPGAARVQGRSPGRRRPVSGL